MSYTHGDTATMVEISQRCEPITHARETVSNKDELSIPERVPRPMDIADYLDRAQANPDFNRNLFMGFAVSMLGAGFVLGLRRGMRKRPKRGQAHLSTGIEAKIQQQQNQQSISPHTSVAAPINFTSVHSIQKVKHTPILLNTPTHLQGARMREHTQALKEAAVAKGEKDYRSAASALAIATVLSVGSFSALVYGSCRALGVDNARDFRTAMQKLLGVVPKPSETKTTPDTPAHDLVARVET